MPDADPRLTADPVRIAWIAAEERKKHRGRIPNFGWSRGPVVALQAAQKGNENEPVDND